MPLIQAEDWLLNATDAVEHLTFTSGNEVVALVNGNHYFSELYRNCLNLLNDSGGGFLFITAWRITPSALLNPDGPTPPVSISEMFKDLMDSGVQIKALLWNVPGTIGDFSPGHGEENFDMFTLINRHENGSAILDDRLPHGTFPSHHQKYIVLGSENYGYTAFIGGIDIAFDRWDTSAHDSPDARESEAELYKGWHDLQAKIRGPAVKQIWESFCKRWNDPRTPNLFIDHSTYSLGEIPETYPQDVIPPSGNQSVQLLHTYPCKSFANPIDGTLPPQINTEYPFVQGSDHSYLNALLKAIEKAEFYIYLEDQYFWPCKIVDSLARAAGRGVSIIVLLTKDYDVPGLSPLHNYMQQSSIQQIIDQCVDPDSPNIFVYHLQQVRTVGQVEGDEIYVHAKTIIIDDCYAVIGSANVNNRSMTNDTEIGIAVVDNATEYGEIMGNEYVLCSFARKLRIKLWEEHLGEEIKDPLLPDGSPNGFPTNPNNLVVKHAKIHNVSDPKWCRPAFIRSILMNPELDCQP